MRINPLTGEIEKHLDEYTIFPGSHYVTPHEKLKYALQKIRDEAEERKAWFQSHGKLLEAQRLEQRVKFDLEMLEQTGFVKGIENYSRYLTNREPGEQPATLMDYFADDYPPNLNLPGRPNLRSKLSAQPDFWTRKLK
jgi:excinuclease ABC subunit B